MKETFDHQASYVAAVSYFAQCFAFAFVLGGFRIKVLAPMLQDNEFLAAVIEIPFILWFSWKTMKRIVTNHDEISRWRMGAVAFALLMVAEVLLSVAMGHTVYSFFYGLIHSNQHRLGLLAQMLFGAFPLVEYCSALDGSPTTNAATKHTTTASPKRHVKE